MTNVNKITKTVPSAAKAIELIENWHDVIPARKRDLISALNTVSKAAGLPPDLMILRPERLRELVLTKSAAGWDVSIDRRANALSLVRSILRRLDVIDSPVALTERWTCLSSMIERRTRPALVTFMRFCVLTGRVPDDVADPILEEFEHWLTSRTLSAAPRTIVTATRRAWNAAVDAVAEWPRAKLSMKSRRRQFLLPFDKFPQPFQMAAVQFRESLACKTADAIFIPNPERKTTLGGRPTSYYKQHRQSTIDSKVQLLKVSANALYRGGTALASIRSLESLVLPPAHPERILRQLIAENHGKITPTIAHVADLLRQVAKYHVDCSPDHIDLLAQWAKSIRPEKPKGMTTRNRKLLGNLWTDCRRRRLYYLPSALMEEALTSSSTPNAVVAARRAAIIELLNKFAPRLSNIINLRVEDHLTRPDPRRTLISEILIPAHETKNGRNLTYPVSAATAKILELWIHRFRPYAAENCNPYVFPGKGKGPMTLQGMRDSVKRITEERVGVAVNPHGFRHLAAKTYMNAVPGGLEGIRQLLGHADNSAATRMYSDWENEAATKHFDSILESDLDISGSSVTKQKKRPNTRKARDR
jgi:integrase